ncbi:hypothetical protein ACFL6E_04605 [Candidatus Neomarinimicrobiota bacterium]
MKNTDRNEQANYRHGRQVKRNLLPLLVVGFFIISGCDFQVVEPPAIPSWGFALNIPLMNEVYLIGEGVADSTTIFRDTTTDEIRIEFADALDTTSIDASFLEVELPAGASPDPVNEAIDAPDASDFFSSVSESVDISLPLDSILSATGQPLLSVTFPLPVDFAIDSARWNAYVASEPINPTAGPFVVLDTAALLSDNSFIKEINYVLLGASGNSFSTTVENNDFPTSIDSILIEIASTPLLVTHDTLSLSKGDAFVKTTDMGGDSLGIEIAMTIMMNLPKAATDSVIIVAGDDPNITINISVDVASVDSLSITTANAPMELPDPEPVPLPGDIEIVRGQMRTGVASPVNTIALTGLSNSLPFDIDFALTFPNFSSDSLGSDSLRIGPHSLSAGQAPISETENLAGDWFLNPGGSTAIEEFEYIITADIQEQTVVLPLDGSPMGAFQATFNVGDLYFESLTGNFHIDFDAVNTTIEDIPSGFAGFLFDRLSLTLYFQNEIDLPVQLDLDMIGITRMGDTMSVPINAPINYPSAPNADNTPGQPAGTVIVLDESSVRTYWVPANSSDITLASWDTTVTDNESSIVDVMNLPPDQLTVGGSAIIQGQGTVQAGKALWGEFELLAPFAFILPQPITFLPVDVTPLAPMDSATSSQIKTALLSATITSRITTDFPIGGNVSMLVSDSTLFSLSFDRLDRLAAGIPDTIVMNNDTAIYTSVSEALAADSIMDISHIAYYPEDPATGNLPTSRTGDRAVRVDFFTNPTDSVPAFWIGRLFDMMIPAPKSTSSEGYVIEPGDTSQVIAMDAERVGWIASAEPLYLKPLITFYKTAGAATLQGENTIAFAAYITFNLSSEIFEAQDPSDTSEISAGSIATVILEVDSSTTIDLTTVFVHSDADFEFDDFEIVAYPSHTGVAAADVLTGVGLLRITGIGTGATNVVVTADDDPEDTVDPVAVNFYVVVNDSPSPSPTRITRLSRGTIVWRD